MITYFYLEKANPNSLHFLILRLELSNVRYKTFLFTYINRAVGAKLRGRGKTAPLFLVDFIHLILKIVICRVDF